VTLAAGKALIGESNYMSSATISATEAASAYTEQPARMPGSASENTPIPPELWAVVVLSVILFVLLVWKAIDEMVDGGGSNGDNSSNRFPPY
jgi:hypothetical protein